MVIALFSVSSVSSCWIIPFSCVWRTGRPRSAKILAPQRLPARLRPMRTAIYPGSFDPLTNGHLDVIERAGKLFDRVVVAVAKNESKHPMFTLEERLDLVKRSIKHLP